MAFVFPRVHLCCCGCSLRIGIYIIAFINLAFYLFLTTLHIKYIGRRIHYDKYIISEVEFLQSEITHILIVSEIVFTLYLFYANFKNNPSYMMPYILIKVTMTWLLFMWLLFHTFLHVNGGYFLEDTFIPIVMLVMVFYSIVIVYSQYRNLKEGQMTSY